MILTGCNSIVALDVGYTSAGILPSIDLSPVTSVQYLRDWLQCNDEPGSYCPHCPENVTFSYNNNMSSITLPSTAPDLTGFTQLNVRFLNQKLTPSSPSWTPKAHPTVALIYREAVTPHHRPPA